MEIKLTGGKVPQFLLKFRILKRTFHFNFLSYVTPSVWTSGYTSRCKDGKHIIFLDYDGISLEEINDELQYLQKYFKLSNFYIFRTDKDDSFHAVNLDKFPLYEAIEIVRNTSADKAFKYAPFHFRKKRWVLRCIEKGDRSAPIYLATVFSKFNKHEKSTAHKLFIKKHYNVKIGKLSKEDGYTKLDITNYNTGNRIGEGFAPKVRKSRHFRSRRYFRSKAIGEEKIK